MEGRPLVVASPPPGVERVRAYWDSRPCNIRHSPEAVGTKTYFDQVEARKYSVEPHIPRFAEFERWRDQRVLEIGCGIGTDTVNFARHGATVTAVDLSARSLELARQRAEIMGVDDRIEFIQGNAEELSALVAREPFDLIYSFGVIHHSPNPGAILDQIRHFAVPETTVKIMVYHRRSWKALWILLVYGKGRFWKHSELIASHSEAQSGCPVTYTYTRHGARAWLRRHGFETTKLQVEHIFPYSIPDYVEYRYRKVWYFRWMPRRLFEALERWLGWHLCVTARVDPSTVERDGRKGAHAATS